MTGTTGKRQKVYFHYDYDFKGFNYNLYPIFNTSG